MIWVFSSDNKYIWYLISSNILYNLFIYTAYIVYFIKYTLTQHITVINSQINLK